MEDREQTLRDLHNRIEEIARRQKAFQDDIQKLHNDIFAYNLSHIDESKQVTVKPSPKEVQPLPDQPKQAVATQSSPTPEPIKPPVTAPSTKPRAPIEEFIGTNLLNKIGIAILVIGIGFGTKYSIDHNLINPLTRIIIGYLWGIGLVIVALRLKKDHENFSAVLVSGGMAVMYFVTFAAYDIYGLLPQLMAFGLMVLFTAFTVFAATQYNREVIGVIGLTGAYAVPFLLSDGSGRVVVLFSYITVINAGILVLSFKKDWRILYYTAFALTWLSFAAWFGTSYNETKHLWTSLIFDTIFFGTFYAMFLSLKLVKNEPLNAADLIVMLLNSFVYYTYGYISIDYNEGGDQFLGVFTVFTALMHFVACAIIFRSQKQSNDLFYFLAGLVLVFLTIAVPVQLDGDYVTIIWSLEAALLFWIGRSKSFKVYERISYALIILAAGSLLQDWQIHYLPQYAYVSTDQERNIFLVNVQFLSTALFVVSVAFIHWLSTKRPLADQFTPVLQFALPGLILFFTFVGIFKEVEQVWNYKYADSEIHVNGEYPYDQFDEDINRYKTLWLIYYSAIFCIALSVIQSKIIKNKYLLFTSLSMNALVVLAFVTSGLYELTWLRWSYLEDQQNAYYYRTIDNITVRYIGLVLIAPLLYFNYRYIRTEVFSWDWRRIENILMHLAVIILLSSELLHWLDMARVDNSDKLSLSILWGCYALFLIVLGLVKDLKHIRISAIVLFGVTLIKLFIYDMADMSTISKTIVFIILGVLMLVASFLYNKFKKTAPNEAH